MMSPGKAPVLSEVFHELSICCCSSRSESVPPKEHSAAQAARDFLPSLNTPSKSKYPTTQKLPTKIVRYLK